jgi:hypothetical protein
MTSGLVSFFRTVDVAQASSHPEGKKSGVGPTSALSCHPSHARPHPTASAPRLGRAEQPCWTRCRSPCLPPGAVAAVPRGRRTGKHVAGRRRSCKLESELPPWARSSADRGGERPHGAEEARGWREGSTSVLLPVGFPSSPTSASATSLFFWLFACCKLRVTVFRTFHVGVSNAFVWMLQRES